MDTLKNKHEPEVEFLLLLPNYGTASSQTPIKARNSKKSKVFKEMNYQCKHCKKKFTKNVGLKSHLMRSHREKVSKVFCSKCSFEGDTNEEIRIHAAVVHLDQFCEICNRTFEKKTCFKKHMNVHENSENFKCKICGAEFESFRGMAGHLYANHKTKHETFQCETCKKNFVSELNLKRHKLNAHESKF
jgi:KRAB domain-containing zinc finger protein